MTKCERCKEPFELGIKKCKKCKAYVSYNITVNGKAYYIPSYMIAGINRYLFDKLPVGDFLTYVFEDSLVGACGRADSHNILNLPAYASFLYNEMPIGSYGSKKAVKQWLDSGKKTMTCKCGNEAEFPVNTETHEPICGLCKRTGCWIEKQNQKETETK